MTLAVLYLLDAFSDQPPTYLEPTASVSPFSNTVVASGTGSKGLPVAPRSEAVAYGFFTPRTPKELVEEQQGNTSLTADEVSKRHEGHWIEVAGHVLDVEDRHDDIRIFLKTSVSNIYVHLGFEKEEWKDKLRSLRKDDIVTAIGEIRRTTDSGISLEKCELNGVRSSSAFNDELNAV